MLFYIKVYNYKSKHCLLSILGTICSNGLLQSSHICLELVAPILITLEEVERGATRTE